MVHYLMYHPLSPYFNNPSPLPACAAIRKAVVSCQNPKRSGPTQRQASTPDGSGKPLDVGFE